MSDTESWSSGSSSDDHDIEDNDTRRQQNDESEDVKQFKREGGQDNRLEHLVSFAARKFLKKQQGGSYDADADTSSASSCSVAPGIVVGIATDAGIVHMSGYGYADVEKRIKLNPDTLFDLASISKHITAACILQCMERNLLKLDDHVSKHVPAFAVPVVGRAVTLQDLLWHTSGLADYTDEDDFDDDDDAMSKLTNESHVTWLNTTKPRRAPGINFEYNNSGYVLLSHVVEKVVKMPFSEYVKENIFRPAGLVSSSSSSSDNNNSLVPGVVPAPPFVMQSLDIRDAYGSRVITGYSGKNPRTGKYKKSRRDLQVTGDGQVFMSVAQLLKWMLVFRSGRAGISPSSLQLAFSNGRLDHHAKVVPYGFGVDTSQYPVLSHDGEWDGSVSSMFVHAKENLTVVVMSNNDENDVSALAEGIFDNLTE